MTEHDYLIGMKVKQFTFIPDDEIWVSEATFNAIKNSIPEISEGKRWNMEMME